MQTKQSKISKLKKNNPNIKKKQFLNYPETALSPFFVYTAEKLKNMEYCKILEVKEIKNSSTPLNPSSYIYYVHYFNYNRRMDEWVQYSNLKITEKTVEDLENERKLEGINSDEEHEGLDAQSRVAHEEVTRLKTINKIKFGKYTSDTWYYSPFPEGYHYIDTLYFCEFCLCFFVKQSQLNRHSERCNYYHPPGNEIYRDTENNISVFEIDGFKNPVYCENLSYLAKLFLDHKLLYYAIDPFLFYVLTENDEFGYHTVGYFSKNKDQTEQNLSCILTLPFHQRKGYGKFLINLSYELSIIEKKMGSPERPLSDLGRQSYISYWSQRIIDYLNTVEDINIITLADISINTYIKIDDIIDTFERTGMLKKGKNGSIIINYDKNFIAQLYKKMGRPALKINLEQLHWYPFKFKYH